MQPSRAFPFRSYLHMRLVAGQKPAFVLRAGEPGSHDEEISYYGSVIQLGDTLHLWYWGGTGPELIELGYGHQRRTFCLCLATSKDGIRWEKPDLGLVEFDGSRHNNICNLPDPRQLEAAGVVIYEPNDPDPNRRFKLAYEAWMDDAEMEAMGGAARLGRRLAMFVAFSPDGLHWTPYGKPVAPWFEMGGLTKFRGIYYCCGQDHHEAQHPSWARRLSTFASTDFITWSPSAALGLNRSPNVMGPQYDADMCEIEEIHLGAALHNRGNVILGVYGQWHGDVSGDRRLIAMDLGLALSHDGLHYHEPVPGFRFVRAREQPKSAVGDVPALMQGQGMEHVGDKTLYWYSLWMGVENTGVRMVAWERDRFGYLKPFKRWEAMTQSLPIEVVGGDVAKVCVNASG